MKIVHFLDGRMNITTAKVGLLPIVHKVASEQVALGHDVTVVSVPDQPPDSPPPNTTYKILEYTRRGLSKYTLGIIPPKILTKSIQSGSLPIDIAHFHSVYSFSAVAVGRVLRKYGIPYALTGNGSFSPLIMKGGPLYFRLMRRLFCMMFARPLAENAALVHVSAEAEARNYNAYWGHAPTVTIESGSNSRVIAELALDRTWLAKQYPRHAESFKLLFLGRLDPFHKGIDRLLEALALVIKHDRDVVLFLAGPPKRRYKHQIPQIIDRLNLHDHVELTGPIYKPFEKYSAMASADVFVLTSRFEGFPLTVYEAAACATPLLVTPGTNATSWIQTNNAGFVCSDTPQDIAQAILTAMRQHDRLSEMGCCAQKAVARLTWRETAQRLVQAYSDVLATLEHSGRRDE